MSLRRLEADHTRDQKRNTQNQGLGMTSCLWHDLLGHIKIGVDI